MPSSSTHTLIRHVHRLAAERDCVGLADRDLLQRFSQQRDETAFAVLVRRHGPMVLGLCRRLLGNSHDADDVFQAVFLVLARKAGSLSWLASVGPWLHEVAWRKARKTRAQIARHRARLADLPAHAPVSTDDLSLRELQGVLDEELNRLPMKLRAPLVLCYLEGATRDEAARQLGCPLGTLKSRLERGRERLRTRLTRRGVMLPAVLLAAGVMEPSAHALPSLPLDSLGQAASLFSTNPRAVELPAAAAALARGMVRDLLLVRLRLALLLLLSTAALAAGAGVLIRPNSFTPPETDRPASEASQPAEKTTAAVGEKLPNGLDPDGEQLPAEAIARLGTTRFRHGESIDSLAFTPDGQTLISCGRPEGVRFWDVATGKESLRPANASLDRNAFLSPDGKWLAVLLAPTNPQEKAIEIRETATGRVVRRFGSQGRFNSLLFSPDSKVLAAFKWQREIELWDPATGDLLHTLKGHKGNVLSVAFSADGKTVVSGGDDKSIRFWDVATGQQRQQIEQKEGVWKVALSPDGKRLATLYLVRKDWGGGMTSTHPGRRVYLWDVATGKLTRQLTIRSAEILPGVEKGFNMLGFAPEGHLLLTRDMDGILRFWDPETGRELRRVEGLIGSIGELAFSPDRKRVALEAGNTSIRLLDLASGKDILPTRGHIAGVSSVVVTPDGQSIVTESWDDTLRFWNPATGRERFIRRFRTDHTYGGGLLPGGEGYLTFEDDHLFRLRDLVTGKETAVLRGLEPRSPFALSPDRKLLALASDKTVRLLDPAIGKGQHTLLKAEAYVFGMTFTPEGRKLIVWSDNRRITVWDTATGQRLHEFSGPRDPHTDARLQSLGSYSATLSPDGKLLALRLQQNILPLLDVETRKEIRRFQIAEDGVSGLAFAPDGKSLAWGGWRTGTVYLGEIATGRLRRKFTGHRGRILSMAFSPDGKFLVSGSNDTTALVWDLTVPLDRASKRDKPLTDAELPNLWRDLADQDAVVGLRAMQGLQSDATHAVAYLRQRLHPVAAVDEQRLAQWIAELDSEQFKVREKAMTELESSGESALQAMRKALAGRPSLEARRRLEQLVEEQVREHWSPSPERVRTGRAVEVLERTGTAEARRVLTQLAGGAPGAWLTIEAQSALDRLRMKP